MEVPLPDVRRDHHGGAADAFAEMKGVVPMANAVKVYKLTKERLREYEEELNHAKTVREREVAEQIKVARSFGDLSENSEYDEAKTEQGKLYSRIAELEDIIAHAVIIEEGETTEEADVGCEVKIRLLSSGKEVTYKIVGSKEADPRQKLISDESPLGRAIVGSKAGDTVSYEAPAGVMRAEILSIERV